MSNKLISKLQGKTDKKNTYKIEKEFSINNITNIKNELDEIVLKSNSFHLELRNLENFDLSALQLLYAIEQKLKGGFTYSIDTKAEIKTILSSSGFESFINK